MTYNSGVFTLMFSSTAVSLLLFISGTSFTLSEDYLEPESDGLGRDSGIAPAAAAGEYEVIALHLSPEKRERELVSWQLVWKGKEGPPATWYRPAIATDFLPGAPQVADALVPLTPVAIRANDSMEILLQLDVPNDQEAGDYRAELRLEFDGGKEAVQDFPFVVYEFALPEARSLATLFDLDLHVLASAYNRPFSDVDAWIPVYDTLQELDIAYRVWFDTFSEGARADEADLQAHRNYVSATGTANLVDVGGREGTMLAHFPEPTVTEPQDGLQLQLYKTQARLPAVAGTLKRVAQPAAFGPRETWHALRQGYARFSRADEHVQRILAAPAHPYFERYAEIWALPMQTAPAILGLLDSGQSLTQYEQENIAVCLGSAGAPDATGNYQTLASEVVDGSEVTHWQARASANVPIPWLEMTFRKLFRLADLTVLHGSEGAWKGIEVETAYNPGEFTHATVDWDVDVEMSPLGRNIARGSFRYPRDCLAVRIRFDRPAGEGAFPSVAEVLFNNPSLESIQIGVPAQSPWLDATSGTGSPWQAGQGKATRALPWRCWTLGFHGILGPVLNAPEAGLDALVGQGHEGLYPTRRLFAFRDGLEDYEYLQILWERVSRKELTLQAGFYPGAGPESFDLTTDGAKLRWSLRKRMGEILSGKSTVTRNFGP